MNSVTTALLYLPFLIRWKAVAADTTSSPTSASTSPSSSTFSGDDFTNNLISDLGPLLSLFGAQVTTQFMSQSLTWADNVLFAIAPLGVITAITAAIRVGGPLILRAVIGRAREPRANIEIELMSSTSREVCEMWNGESIVRVPGAPTMVELVVYLGNEGSEPKICKKDCFLGEEEGEGRPQETEGESNSGNSDNTNANGHERKDLEQNAMAFNAAISPKEEEKDELDKPTSAPTISLNYGNSRRETEIVISALVSILLQFAVLTFDGLIVYYWKLRKSGQPISPSAFPCIAAGTVMLTIGMMMCSAIVEQSTKEKWYRSLEGGKILWMQREGVVSDQNFGSYAIFAAEGRHEIVTSEREDYFQPDLNGGEDEKTTLKAFLVKAVTVVAVLVSLAGFVVQFIGFRKMHWLATIIQFSLSLLMTAWRSYVRRDLSTQPLTSKLPRGYEIDWLATRKMLYEPGTRQQPDMFGGGRLLRARRRLKDLLAWVSWVRRAISSQDSVLWEKRKKIPWYGNEDDRVEWFVVDDKIEDAGERDHTLNRSESVLKIRECLWDLTGWCGPATEVAFSLVYAIQAAMNEISDPRLFTLEHGDLVEFKWGFCVGDGADPVWLYIRREDGMWKADQARIEAALSLWVYQLSVWEMDDKRSGKACTRNVWRIGPSSEEVKRDFSWWVYRESKPQFADIQLIGGDKPNRIMIDGSKVPRFRAFGPKVSRLEDSPNKNPSRMIVDSTRSLPEMCAWHLFSIFMSFASKEIEEVKGTTNVQTSGPKWEHSGGRLSDLVRLANTSLQGLAQKVESSRLCSLEEAYMAIILPLSASRKLPTPSAVIEKTLQTTRSLEAQRNWKDAAELYVELLKTCKSFGAYHPMMVEATAVSAEFFSILENAERIYKNRAQRDVLEEISKSRELVCEEISGGDEEVRHALVALYSYQGQIRGSKDLRYYPQPPTGTGSEDAEFVEYSQWGKQANIFSHVAGNKTEILESLLNNKNSPNLDVQDVLGWTPLHYAALHGDHHRSDSRPTCLQLLLKARANPNIPNILGRTPLHYAAAAEGLGAVDLLVQYGARMEAKSGDGRTPLHFAAQDGNARMVNHLYDKGADIEARDSFEQTPLYLAASEGRVSVVELLLDRRAEARARESFGLTPLHAIAGQSRTVGGVESVVGRLLAGGAPLEARDQEGRTPLHWAARSGSKEVASVLMSMTVEDRTAESGNGGGSQMREKMGIWVRDQAGMTPLHWAAEYGNLEVARIYPKCSDTAARDRNRRTPLHLAAAHGQIKLVDLLLDRNLKVESADDGGMTPLHMAKGEEVTGTLLAHGANIHARDNKGRKPIHCLMELKVVRLLLQKYGESKYNHLEEMEDEEGMTPLHRAAQFGDVSVVESHLDDGAPIEAKNKEGKTPLHMAIESGNIPSISLLLNRNALLAAKDSNDMGALDIAIISNQKDVVPLLLKEGIPISPTSLHCASERNRFDIVKLLLRKRPDVDVRGNKGMTPLHMAVEHGNMDIADLLVKAGANLDVKDDSGKTPLDLIRMEGVRKSYRTKWEGRGLDFKSAVAN